MYISPTHLLNIERCVETSSVASAIHGLSEIKYPLWNYMINLIILGIFNEMHHHAASTVVYLQKNTYKPICVWLFCSAYRPKHFGSGSCNLVGLYAFCTLHLLVAHCTHVAPPHGSTQHICISKCKHLHCVPASSSLLPGHAAQARRNAR